jgi:Ca2+-binding EF-hand superfamily protein
MPKGYTTVIKAILREHGLGVDAQEVEDLMHRSTGKILGQLTFEEFINLVIEMAEYLEAK